MKIAINNLGYTARKIFSRNPEMMIKTAVVLPHWKSFRFAEIYLYWYRCGVLGGAAAAVAGAGGVAEAKFSPSCEFPLPPFIQHRTHSINLENKVIENNAHWSVDRTMTYGLTRLDVKYTLQNGLKMGLNLSLFKSINRISRFRITSCITQNWVLTEMNLRL